MILIKCNAISNIMILMITLALFSCTCFMVPSFSVPFIVLLFSLMLLLFLSYVWCRVLSTCFQRIIDNFQCLHSACFCWSCYCLLVSFVSLHYCSCVCCHNPLFFLLLHHSCYYILHYHLVLMFATFPISLMSPAFLSGHEVRNKSIQCSNKGTETCLCLPMHL